MYRITGGGRSRVRDKRWSARVSSKVRQSSETQVIDVQSLGWRTRGGIFARTRLKRSKISFPRFLQSCERMIHQFFFPGRILVPMLVFTKEKQVSQAKHLRIFRLDRCASYPPPRQQSVLQQGLTSHSSVLVKLPAP